MIYLSSSARAPLSTFRPRTASAWIRRCGTGLFLLPLVVVGCSHRLPPPRALPIQEAAERLAPIRDSALAVRRYQAVARVRGRGPEGRFSATLLVAFERPENLRVELLGPFSGSRWMALAVDGEITVLFPSRREFLRESSIPDVLAALVGVRWNAGEVMAVLAGSGLPLEGSLPTAVFQEGNTTRVELHAQADRSLSVRLRENQVIEASAPDYRVFYPSAWRSRGRSAPDRIEVRGEQVTVEVAISDLDINVALEPEVFRLDIPPGTSRVEVREIGGQAVFVKSAR